MRDYHENRTNSGRNQPAGRRITSRIHSERPLDEILRERPHLRGLGRLALATIGAGLSAGDWLSRLFTRSHFSPAAERSLACSNRRTARHGPAGQNDVAERRHAVSGSRAGRGCGQWPGADRRHPSHGPVRVLRADPVGRQSQFWRNDRVAAIFPEVYVQAWRQL